MKYINYLFSTIWRLWFFIVFLFTFFSFLPLLFIFTGLYKKEETVCYIARYWSKIILFTSFIYPKIEWEEKINLNQPYIICANHASSLDIPFILSIINLPIQFIGKVELSKIPLFGYFFKHNSVIVNRKNKKDGYNAFLNANKKLQKNISICIFPEGGIPPKNIFLKNFKNGAFKLASENNIKIIPITMPDNKLMFPQTYYDGYPGRARIKVHKHIDPTRIKKNTPDNMKELVYNIIFDQLKKYESNK